MGKTTASAGNTTAPLPKSLVQGADEALAHAGDEYWGQGGRYVVVDGKRLPAPIDEVTEENGNG
ncbi:hypothetical protein [Rhodocyclus tenuis]|uniref:Uncharacterized protein n=1 Tax=Rhodocyclus tenuis TaxID=1066 RepID=A0A840G1V8_RHOTE|nr:hypothetical protein [Rhodocyclus tenuis]MBB4248387.1 hypothetical protein [Rhodocyclus tenuis]